MSDQKINESTTTLNDADLIEAVRKKPDKFRLIYDKWLTPIYRYVYARLRNQQDAEDVTSQVFLSAFQGLDRYKDKGYFSAWLYGIARNKIREFNRSHNMSDVAIDDLSQQEILNSLSIMEDDGQVDLEFLNNKIRTLVDKDQELVYLRYVAQLKYAEIGIIVNKSPGAVKKRLYRIQSLLKTYMESQNE